MVALLSPSRVAAVRDTRGASLIIALVLSTLLIVLAAGSFAAVMELMRVTHQVERANAAYFAAESGVELALYDITNYDDGYQYVATDTVCTDTVAPIADTTATSACGTGQPYRFVDFETEGLSDARSFWQLFARTFHEGLNASNARVVPDPFFAGDKDGLLEVGSGADTEWGRITKTRPVSLALQADVAPDETDPTARYDYLTPDLMSSGTLTFMVDSADLPGSPNFTGDEPLLLWTMSAIDGFGEEYTLQGVARESDITQRDCDGDGVSSDWCIVFDLTDDLSPIAVDNLNGDMHAGEDINKNIGGDDATDNVTATFNRVAGITHDWHMNAPDDFLAALQSARDSSTVANGYADAWLNARLTVSMIGTLSETSGIDSDSLLYRFDVWPDPSIEVADEYTYIIAEGFSGTVKQSIETRFKRQSTIPVFSYAVFQ